MLKLDKQAADRIVTHPLDQATTASERMMTDTSSTSSVPIGVLTVSDRAFQGVYEDKGGPGIVAALSDIVATPWHAMSRIVPDEQATIENALREMADTLGCCLILTTGGTGPALRDVTVEATMAVADRIMPGFGELMRTVSLREVPTAILSRQEAVLRGQSLPPAAHIALSRHFGALEIHVLDEYHKAEYPEIFELSNIGPDGKPKEREFFRDTETTRPMLFLTRDNTVVARGGLQFDPVAENKKQQEAASKVRSVSDRPPGL
jgi:molybdopterin adenylyltransferase